MNSITEQAHDIPILRDADVVVVGGGIAGVAAALAASGNFGPAIAQMNADTLRTILIKRSVPQDGRLLAFTITWGAFHRRSRPRVRRMNLARGIIELQESTDDKNHVRCSGLIAPSGAKDVSPGFIRYAHSPWANIFCLFKAMNPHARRLAHPRLRSNISQGMGMRIH